MVAYFTAYAESIAAPIRCGVAVTALDRLAGTAGFRAETTQGPIEARNVVVATGPFQRGIVPAVVPADAGLLQIHSSAYRNPNRLPEGAILVIGGGSSGTQIADELMQAGRKVFLSLGAHQRPPRRYRGRDYCWWLGVLGMWDLPVPAPDTKHVTIAVSGAYGGQSIDFRRLAARGVTLLGRSGAYRDGFMEFAPDLMHNLNQGDAAYLALLDAADAYAAREGLDLPDEPTARCPEPEPDCVIHPVLHLDLQTAGITTIIWATGYALDFGWLHCGSLDERGKPIHQRGITETPGLYFLGLIWLSRRASSFVFGAEYDAAHLAAHIAGR